MDKLKLINRLKIFGKSFKNLGIALLVITGILSLICFWTGVASYYEPFKDIAVMFLKLITLSMQMIASGIFIYVIFLLIESVLIKKRISRINIAFKKRRAK